MLTLINVIIVIYSYAQSQIFRMTADRLPWVVVLRNTGILSSVSRPQSTHRVAIVTVWHTLHQDEKINPAWWSWRVARPSPSLFLPSRTKLCCTLQPRGQVHYTLAISTLPLYVLCWQNWLSESAYVLLYNISDYWCKAGLCTKKRIKLLLM